MKGANHAQPIDPQHAALSAGSPTPVEYRIDGGRSGALRSVAAGGMGKR